MIMGVCIYGQKLLILIGIHEIDLFANIMKSGVYMSLPYLCLFHVYVFSMSMSMKRSNRILIVVQCKHEGEKVVDADNMCWFHMCVMGQEKLYLIPMRCALGSKISYNFISGQFNPCTINFYDVIGEWTLLLLL